MPLEADLNQGLAELQQRTQLDELKLDHSGWCRIEVPIPAQLRVLHEGRLVIEVQLSKAGNFFSLYTPVAVAVSEAGKQLGQTLLYRQFYAGQVAGASFALSTTDDNDVLVAIYHWMLDSISPAQFMQLYQRFIVAALQLIEEVNTLAHSIPDLHPVHSG